MQRTLHTCIDPSPPSYPPERSGTDSIPMGNRRPIGLPIASPPIVGARDYPFGKSLKVPPAVVQVVSAFLVRLLRKRRAYCEMGALEDHFIPGLGDMRTRFDEPIFAGDSLVPTLSPEVLMVVDAHSLATENGQCLQVGSSDEPSETAFCGRCTRLIEQAYPRGENSFIDLQDTGAMRT